jgi:large subunit ribosomal protein L5
MVRLKERYEQEIIPKLMEEIGVPNKLRAPKLAKIILNMGIGIADKDVLKKCSDQLGVIAGQKAVLTKARKSISNFKLREGMTIGAKVTLRGNRMYEFLDRLINAALPRIRDFRGLSPSAFDGKGNYSMGLKEQTIFPEIDPDDVGAVQGMDITIVTTSESDKEAFSLLKLLGMPFSSS